MQFLSDLLHSILVSSCWFVTWSCLFAICLKLLFDLLPTNILHFTCNPKLFSAPFTRSVQVLCSTWSVQFIANAFNKIKQSNSMPPVLSDCSGPLYCLNVAVLTLCISTALLLSSHCLYVSLYNYSICPEHLLHILVSRDPLQILDIYVYPHTLQQSVHTSWTWSTEAEEEHMAQQGNS